jgi:hypothetical protein
MIQILLFGVGAAFIWLASKAFRLFTLGGRPYSHRQYSLAEQYENDCEAECSILEVDVDSHLSPSRDCDHEDEDDEDDVETTIRLNDIGGELLETE